MKINFFTPSNFYQQRNIKNNQRFNWTIPCDTVSFSARKNEEADYKRMGGLCEMFYKKEGIAEDCLEQVPILKNKMFGPSDYKKLNEKEKEYLRSLLNFPYLKHVDNFDIERTIENDMQFLVKTAYKLKNILDYKYPEGWNFVAIGGSCAPFAKILEYMGAETAIVPYSKSVKYKEGYDDIDFNKYFNDLGFFPDKNKTTIYADFVSSGETLRDFQQYIKSTGLSSDKDIFVNFTDLFDNALSKEENFLLDDWFFDSRQIKSYSPCPNMNNVMQYKNAKNMEKNFEWNFTTKLMSFAVLDCLEEWRKNKWI